MEEGPSWTTVCIPSISLIDKNIKINHVVIEKESTVTINIYITSGVGLVPPVSIRVVVVEISGVGLVTPVSIRVVVVETSGVGLVLPVSFWVVVVVTCMYIIFVIYIKPKNVRRSTISNNNTNNSAFLAKAAYCRIIQIMTNLMVLSYISWCDGSFTMNYCAFYLCICISIYM